MWKPSVNAIWLRAGSSSEEAARVRIESSKVPRRAPYRAGDQVGGAYASATGIDRY